MPEQPKTSIKFLPKHHSDFPVSVLVDWVPLIAGMVGTIMLFLGLRWLRSRRRD